MGLDPRHVRLQKETKNKDKGDDPFLDFVFNKGGFDLKTLWLPKTYNRMDKHSSHWSDIPNDEVVINHDFLSGGHREN